LLSIFNSIDQVNFGEEKRHEDRITIEKFLYDLLEKSIEPEVERFVAEETNALRESARPPKEHTTSGSFLSMILREQDRNVVAQINPARKREEKLAELKMKIWAEVEKYFLHCRSIDWIKVMEEHPTENYKKEEVLQETTLNETQLKNPMYIAHRFDMLSWWRKVGSLLFPYMATGAPIILAKPAHNGYQGFLVWVSFVIVLYATNKLWTTLKCVSLTPSTRIINVLNSLTQLMLRRRIILLRTFSTMRMLQKY
jgi:hypothetical protein